MSAALTREEIAAGCFLGIHYAAWIAAHAEDEPPPEVHETLGARPEVGASLEVVRTILGLDNSPASKMRVARFLAGLADMLAAQGGELEVAMHRMTRPDDPEKIAFVLEGEGAEELARRLKAGA